MKNEKLKIYDLSSNIFIAFLRGIGLGISNFWRNKFLSLATITVIAVILFIFNTILAVHFISNQALQTLNEHADIVVYLRDDVSFDEVQNLTQNLQKMNGVKTVQYTSKEEALARMGKIHPQTADFLKKFDLPNPLPPSISIVIKTPEDFQNIQNFLEKSEVKNLIKNYVTEGGSNESAILSNVAQNLTNINQFVRQIIFWIVLVFVVGGTLVVINAIQLTIYTRRNEIYIMRLVGATPGFIRLPFIFEGILYSVMAVLLSMFFLFLLGKSIHIQESNLWDFYTNLELKKVFIAELLITILIGMISSFSATQQYIKGKLIVNS